MGTEQNNSGSRERKVAATSTLRCGSGQPEPLDQQFWNNRYLTHSTGWDLGMASPPLTAYADQLQNKHLRILIPGCGSGYEAQHLLEQGFTDITMLDIAPVPVEQLQSRFAGNPHIRIILGDFFVHQGPYDLILEQTFFCALDPAMRPAYAQQVHKLLAPEGRLAGVLFDREFEQPGPPFGGTRDEYRLLFETLFRFHTFEACYNSVKPRQGAELFINLQKKQV